MQVYLKTLGCRLNEAEIESWSKGYQSKGHHIVTRPENADLLVVNTCAVTQEAVKKSRQIIRRTHRQNPQAKLVVSGCYASLDNHLQQDIDSIDLIVSNKDKDQLVDISLKELDLNTTPSAYTQPGESAIFQRGRNRAFIKIQDGCRYRCTYCIVTIARGNERSRSASDIIDEINALHDKGVQEIVLTGVHVGGYGSDIQSSLYELIKMILAETNIPRIRLASVEPWDLPEPFFTLFSNKRLMPHMHLPLQSGDDDVLKRMARRCKTRDFAKLIEQARQQVEGFNLTTDIIVGFPGETEHEWQRSYDFIKKVGFSHIHIFTYSARAGTKAATLPNPVDKQIQKQRSQQLHKLAQSMRQDFIKQHLGQTRPVLWEMKDEQDKWYGYTDNYIRVESDKSQSRPLENNITNVTLTGVSDDASNAIVSFN